MILPEILLVHHLAIKLVEVFGRCIESNMYQFEERVSVLKKDLLIYGNEIVEHVGSLYSSKRTKNNLIDLKQDPKSAINMLSHEFSEIVKISKEQSEYAHIHLDAIQECSHLIAVLDGLITVTSLLSDCEKAINTFKVLSACNLVKEIEIKLVQFTSDSVTSIATGKVFTDLHNEHLRIISKLKSKLKRSLTECIRFENGRVIVSKVIQGMLRSEDIVLEEPIKLSELWEAVVLMKLEEEFVSDLSNDIWIYLLKPLWTEKKSHPVPRPKNEIENCVELIFENIHKEARTTSNSKGTIIYIDYYYY